jgi:hypothetical protein
VFSVAHCPGVRSGVGAHGWNIKEMGLPVVGAGGVSTAVSVDPFWGVCGCGGESVGAGSGCGWVVWHTVGS